MTTLGILDYRLTVTICQTFNPQQFAGEGEFFTNWGSAWDFGTNSQLTGQIIDGTTYRDRDGDGVID